MNLRAIIDVEIPASQDAARAAERYMADPAERFADTPEWLHSEAQALPKAVAAARNAMRGWQQSRTDVMIAWSGVRGWNHIFQTYWEKKS